MAIKPCTLILKATHDANLGVKVDLKKQFLHILKSTMILKET